jgi:uncharacterized protein (DUF2147 family)
MKRLCSVATLMLLTTPAHAGTLYSFQVGGRTISISAPRGCASLECISVTTPGVRDAAARHASANNAMGPAPHHETRPAIQAAGQHSANSLQSSSSAESPAATKASISPPKAEVASTQAQRQIKPIAAASTTPARKEPSSVMAAPAISTPISSPADAASSHSWHPPMVVGLEPPKAAPALSSTDFIAKTDPREQNQQPAQSSAVKQASISSPKKEVASTQVQPQTNPVAATSTTPATVGPSSVMAASAVSASLPADVAPLHSWHPPLVAGLEPATVAPTLSSTEFIAKPAAHTQSRPDQIADQKTAALLKSPLSVESSAAKQASISPPKTEVAPAQVKPQTKPVAATSTTPATKEPSSVTAAPAVSPPLPTTAWLADAKSNSPASPSAEDASRPRSPLVAGLDTQTAASAPKPPKKAVPSESAPPALAYYAVAPVPRPSTTQSKAAPITMPIAGSSNQPVLQSNFNATTGLVASAPSEEISATTDPNRKSPSDREHFTSPLGSWFADGTKSSIRIKPCGPYLCGYASSSSLNQIEEKTLIDLKPISSTEWVGMILNHDTGITYPTIVKLQDENSLRLRTCALRATFCDGQVWSREASVLAVR